VRPDRGKSIGLVRNARQQLADAMREAQGFPGIERPVTTALAEVEKALDVLEKADDS